MKWLIGLDIQINGTAIYAEGFYQTAIGDMSTKIYLRGTIKEFSNNTIHFDGNVSIQPGFGLTPFLNMDFSSSGRINVKQIGDILFEITDFYMESGDHKLEKDNVHPVNLVQGNAQLSIYDPRLNQDKMIPKYQQIFTLADRLYCSQPTANQPVTCLANQRNMDTTYLNQRLQLLNQQVSTKQTEIDAINTLVSNNTSCQSKLTDLQGVQKQSNQDLPVLQSILNSLQTELAGQTKKLNDIQSSITTQQGTNTTLTQQNEKYTQDISDMQLRAPKIQNELSTNTAKNADLQNQLKQLSSKSIEIQGALDKLISTISDPDAKEFARVSQLRSQVSLLLNESKQLLDQSSQKQVAVQEIVNQQKTITQLQDQLAQILKVISIQESSVFKTYADKLVILYVLILVVAIVVIIIKRGGNTILRQTNESVYNTTTNKL